MSLLVHIISVVLYAVFLHNTTADLSLSIGGLSLSSDGTIWYNQTTFHMAVVQATPVMFDKGKCLEKALRLIDESADNGAELIVFPELFIPGYPFGMTFGFTVGSRTAPGRKDWGLYYDNSILVPGPETEILGRAAREARAYVSIGVSERDAVNATLYNTNLIFSPAEAEAHRRGAGGVG